MRVYSCKIVSAVVKLYACLHLYNYMRAHSCTIICVPTVV